MSADFADLVDLIRNNLVEHHVNGHVFVFADIDVIFGTSSPIDILRYCQYCKLGAVLRKRNDGSWHVDGWYDGAGGNSRPICGEVPSCKQVRMRKALI